MLFGQAGSVTWGPACWGICSHPVPYSRQVPEKINHTKISISYKADWPIRSGYLLALITYVTPLSLSRLAIWLGTFFSCQLTWCCFGDLRRSGRGNFLIPSLLLFSLPHLYVLSVFPAYTSCLANQCLFKTWLTEYKQFSHTTSVCY